MTIKSDLYNELADLFPPESIDAQCLVEIVEDVSVRNVQMLINAIKAVSDKAYMAGIHQEDKP